MSYDSRLECKNTSFTFIDQSNSNAVKDPARQQLARTHAIQFALKTRRHKICRAGGNFVAETPESFEKRLQKRKELASEQLCSIIKGSSSLGSTSIDPFDCLSVSGTRLTELLRKKTSLVAGEPIFSVNAAIRYNGLQTVFQTGLEDGALTTALCLTLAFGANEWTLDQECLRYKLRTIRHIRQKLACPQSAATTATIGAILLLLGVEYRLGEQLSAQTHLQGLRSLLRLCQKNDVVLPAAMRRGLYWQDLFTSLIVGTDRILSYDIFPISETSEIFELESVKAPSGFVECLEELGEAFVEVTRDVHTLFSCRATLLLDRQNPQAVHKVDSLQAWIEGRLCDLKRTSTNNDILSSCIVATFLCTYGFYDEVWHAMLIPKVLSRQLLGHIYNCESSDFWDSHAEMLLWLIHIGKSFAVETDVRAGFNGLEHGIHQDALKRMSQNWEDTLGHLRKFIWSDVFFSPERGAFWERVAKVHS